MKQLRFFICILLAINIFSCYSTNDPEGEDNNGDIIWDQAGSFPYSGIIPDVRIAVASNGNIWAQAFDKLYLSTDNGNTWVKKNNTPFYWGSITVSPVNDYLFASPGSFGVYRSTDNGENWENIMDNTLSMRGILFAPSGDIYIGVRKGLGIDECGCYYSNDNGNTWIEKSSTVPNNFFLLALGKNGTLYAGSSMGVYHSTNGGDTWLPSSNYNDNNVQISSLTICNDGSIFATKPTYGAMILKSTDEGLNWNNVNTRVNANHFDKIIFNSVTKDIFVISIILDYSVSPSPIYEIYRSVNLGESWRLENIGLPDAKYYDLVFNHTTGQMFISTDDGVYRTKNYPN